MLHSKGSLGNTPMYIGLYPYAGRMFKGMIRITLKLQDTVMGILVYLMIGILIKK